jgi:hypothetical protein
MRKPLVSAALLLCVLALPFLVPEAHAQAEFSATMQQTMDKGQSMTARVYMGQGKTRTEMSHEGQERITIVDNAQQVAWMLNPAKQEYVEMRGQGGGQAGTPNRPPLPDEPASPCQSKESGITCTKIGPETLNGRQAEKWEMVMTQGQQTSRMLVWIDPRLKMAVRQEAAGGYVSELRDIKEAPQPAELFIVPAGYKKVDMPKPQQGGTQGQAPGAPGQGNR